MNKEPEKEDGNIEYKLHILNKTSERIEELSTQMSYRLEEGNKVRVAKASGKVIS